MIDLPHFTQFRRNWRIDSVYPALIIPIHALPRPINADANTLRVGLQKERGWSWANPILQRCQPSGFDYDYARSRRREEAHFKFGILNSK
jgi:hypothetical protein